MAHAFFDKQEAYATKMQMEKENYEQGKKLIIGIRGILLSSGVWGSSKIYNLVIIASTYIVHTVYRHGSKSYTYINSFLHHSILR